MQALIASLVTAILLLAVFGTVGAQNPPAGPSAEMLAEKATEKDDKVAALTAVGRVKSVSPDSLVVRGKSKGQSAEWTFALDAKTKIRKAGKDVTAADLKEGDGVQIRYVDQGGKNVAQTVRARATTPKSEAKPPEKPAEKKP